MIAIYIILFLILIILLVSYITYRMTFYSSGKAENLLLGDQYEEYKKQMTELENYAKSVPLEEVFITSYDGLMLCGRYYHYSDNAPVEIMMHGYKGTAQRDMGGGIKRCIEAERNVLIVDQRAHGASEGRTITFGIKERYDCLAWTNYVISRFGKDTKILLTGISMGASTVLMATGLDLPKNVVGVLSDCGYSSPKEIIKKVVAERGYPVKLVYPFIKLGARIFGGFNLEQTDVINELKKCKVPVLFIHGEDDRFVPCQMTVENYNACPSKKMLFTVPGAGHGLCFLADNEGYINTLNAFTKEIFADEE